MYLIFNFFRDEEISAAINKKIKQNKTNSIEYKRKIGEFYEFIGPNW